MTGGECVRRSREIGRYGGGLRKKRSRREYLVGILDNMLVSVSGYLF